MSKQLLIDAYRGKRTESAPWVPYSGVHCAFLIDEKADVFLKSPELLAKGVVHTAKQYKADGIPLLFDLSVEANSVGCELKWWEDNVPSISTHPCSDKTPTQAELMVPTKDSGRWPQIFEAAKLAKPQLDELDCALMGLVCGPLTLASHLAGVRIFTDVYKNPEFIFLDEATNSLDANNEKKIIDNLISLWRCRSICTLHNDFCSDS